MLKINNKAIPTPKEFSVSINDQDNDSARNAKGEMMRDRICIKRKLNIKWPPLSQSDCSALLNAVSDVFFNVTYPDPQLGMVTKTMYVGERSTPMYIFDKKTGIAKWGEVSFNLIER